MLVGIVLALRFVCIILASAIFVFTTDPGELAYALIRAGIPYRYGFMLVTAIRFIPVFESEAGTVRCAQQARGLDIDGQGLRALINSARYTLLPLVVSALSKVDVLVISMEGRAFGVKPWRTSLRRSRFAGGRSSSSWRWPLSYLSSCWPTCSYGPVPAPGHRYLRLIVDCTWRM